LKKTSLDLLVKVFLAGRLGAGSENGETESRFLFFRSVAMQSKGPAVRQDLSSARIPEHRPISALATRKHGEGAYWVI
jgi:hypothetical protein